VFGQQNLAQFCIPATATRLDLFTKQCHFLCQWFPCSIVIRLTPGAAFLPSDVVFWWKSLGWATELGSGTRQTKQLLH